MEFPKTAARLMAPAGRMRDDGGSPSSRSRSSNRSAWRIPGDAGFVLGDNWAGDRRGVGERPGCRSL